MLIPSLPLHSTYLNDSLPSDLFGVDVVQHEITVAAHRQHGFIGRVDAQSRHFVGMALCVGERGWEVKKRCTVCRGGELLLKEVCLCMGREDRKGGRG